MTKSFARLGAGAAVVAAIAGVTYTVTFALVVQKGYRWAQWSSSTALLVGSLCAMVVAVAAWRRFSGDEPDFGLLALLLASGGAFGALTHAVSDLAVLAKPSGGTGSGGPFPTDPRGLATFALSGVALGLFGWLGARSGALSSLVRGLAVATAVCLLVVFVGRLVVLDPKAAAVKPFAIAAGSFLTPATFLCFARSFMGRGGAPRVGYQVAGAVGQNVDHPGPRSSGDRATVS